MKQNKIWAVIVGKRVYRKNLTKRKAQRIKRDLEGAVENVGAYRMVGL